MVDSRSDDVLRHPPNARGLMVNLIYLIISLQFVYRWSILFFPLAKVGYGSWHLIPGGTENELWVTAPGDDLSLFVHEL